MIVFVLAFASFGVHRLFRSSAFVPTLRGNDGEFTPIAPDRIFDETVNAGEKLIIVAGKGGIPTSGVRAVSFNITVSLPTANGYMVAYPSSSPLPDSSTINFNAKTGGIANDVTVSLGVDGNIKVFNKYGTARLILDVTGFYSNEQGPNGSRYVPITPDRLYDSKVLPASTNPVAVTGGDTGVPATGVSAVVVNLTIDSPDSAGYVTAFPSGSALPPTSSINFQACICAIANEITVKVGPDGKANFYNAFGNARMIVDIAGYYTTEGNRFVGMNPVRASDSSFDENQTKRIRLTGVKGVPPSHVKAVLINVTAALPSKPGYLTVYPSDAPLPPSSSLNFNQSSGAIANQIIAMVGADGYVNVQNRWGKTRVILDISGYFLNNDQLEVLEYDSSKLMPPNPNVSLVQTHNNISYGPSASQNYDIYETANQPAKAAANQDTLVWFYGGGWESGSNTLSTGYDTIAKHLAAQYGYTLVAADYRKSGEASYPAQYQDAVAVIKDLKARASSLGINPNRLVIGGFSAGGDLAAMAGHGFDAPLFQPAFVSASAAAQSAQVYRILTFATPFNKTAWASSYHANASPIAGLNKLLGSPGSTSSMDYSNLNILPYASSNDPPHYTVMSRSDEVIPFTSQFSTIQQMGSRAPMLFQYGGPSGHVSGLDSNMPAMLEYLK